SPLPASVPAVAAHELPVVAPEPVAQRLVSLAPDAAPIPLPPAPNRPRPISTPLTTNEPFETPPAPHLTLGQSRRLGLGPPIKRVSDRSVQRTAVGSTPPNPPGDPSTPLPATVQRLAQASPLPRASSETRPAPRDVSALTAAGSASLPPPTLPLVSDARTRIAARPAAAAPELAAIAPLVS